MAITTLDGVVAGMRPPESIYKTDAAEVAGTHHSHFYAAGRPGAAVAPSPGTGGTSLTTYAGQIPWTNPGAGNSYLARFAMSGTTAGAMLLCDRLWHNSGLSVTSTSPQGITMGAAIPARDRDGSTNGVDVLAAVEVSTVTGAGTPVCTLTYTDSDNNTGVTTTFTGLTAANVGTFHIWQLAAGDVGVRAVTSYQQNVTWTSGSIHIVLFRVLAQLDLTAPNITNAVDAVTGGFVRIYNDSVPFLVSIPSATTATNYSGQMIVTQG